MANDVWQVGEAYERYVGRWSRRVAEGFLGWLGVPPNRAWLDVGCGTGALTATILAVAEPAQVVGIDPSEGFLTGARAGIADARARFTTGDAQDLPVADNEFEAVVSGLAINFVPDPHRAATEFARVTRPGGTAAAYVWDYAEGMQMMRHFWDCVAVLDPANAGVDEGSRFTLCRPEPLAALWTGAGFAEVAVHPIEIPMLFADFDDYWQPFLGGQGPGPAYVATLTERHRDALRDLLRDRLPVRPDGAIPLTARAWAVRGTAA